MPNKSVSWGYVAGFFDGEGCISIFATSSGPRVRVIFSQAVENDWVLHEINDFLSAQGIESRFQISHRERQNPMNELTIRRWDHTERFLRFVIPYLIVKRKKADEALGVLEEMKPRRRKPRTLANLSVNAPQERKRSFAKVS